MIPSVRLEWLWKVSSYGGLNQQSYQSCEAIGAADQQWSLPVLVLHVRVYTAPDQKLDHALIVVLAGHVQRCRKLPIYQVCLGTSTFND